MVGVAGERQSDHLAQRHKGNESEKDRRGAGSSDLSADEYSNHHPPGASASNQIIGSCASFIGLGSMLQDYTYNRPKDEYHYDRADQVAHPGSPGIVIR